MNVATKALRRGSVRLRSYGCKHSELNLIISDMKEVRSAAKRFAEAQETSWKHLVKWANKERNIAVRDTFSCLSELNHLWTEVQNDFIDQINKFKYAFEMILEGETAVDKIRERLSNTEEREAKLTKELQKAPTKFKNSTEIRKIEQQLADTKSAIKNAQIEISEKVNENEAIKVIRLKEGLIKLSDSYVDMAYKSSVIFDGTKSVASSLPEVEIARGVQEVRYRGVDVVKLKVSRIIETVKSYKPRNQTQAAAPSQPQAWYNSPPPPYVYPMAYNSSFRSPGDNGSDQNSASASWRY